MKKLVLGVVIGVAVSVPVGVLAKNVELPWTNNIYRVSDTVDTPTVSVFDDADNKCYVLSRAIKWGYPDVKSISCVKK